MFEQAFKNIDALEQDKAMEAELEGRPYRGQATLPIINKSKWSALTVWLPPALDEQEQIVAKFDALREETQRLEAIYQQKLAALDELKKIPAAPSLFWRAITLVGASVRE